VINKGISLLNNSEFCQTEPQRTVVQYLYSLSTSTISNKIGENITPEDVIRGLIIATALLAKSYDLNLKHFDQEEALKLLNEAYIAAELDLNIPRLSILTH